MNDLTILQRRICNQLQLGIPFTEKPFERIARKLNSTESEILKQTQSLKDAGIIRRLRASINYQSLGITSTLVAVHVPPQKFTQVVSAVNALQGVSHNYSRDHHYNLWFTLQGKDQSQIDSVLADLGRKFDLDFKSLPVIRQFKLDVRFDAEHPENVLLLNETTFNAPPIDISLNADQKWLLDKLQNEIEIKSEPVDFLLPRFTFDQFTFQMEKLIEAGVIKRFGAIVDHRKIGLKANAMFAAQIDDKEIESTGSALAQMRQVSHCYQRQTADQWPYDLFAMMHAPDDKTLKRAVKEFTTRFAIDSFVLLPTVAELKKKPVPLFRKTD